MHPFTTRILTSTCLFASLLATTFFTAPARGQYDPHPADVGYQQDYRNQFHFSPKTEWMNDINALIYADGKYHMLYQWGKAIRHGGYATSPDLLHWNDRGVALIPQESFLPAEAKRNVSGAQVYSGSGVLISGQTAEKITGSTDEAMVMIYTGTKSGTCLAWSNDGGESWHDYPGNPVANRTQGADPRDPCVIYHQPTQSWVMALYENGTTFYGSNDLVNWKKLSNIDFGFECPDLFELPLDGNPDQMKWVLHDANGSYLVGQFDGVRFTPEQDVLVMDVGPDFYAGQTFFRPTLPSGDVIQIAWNDHWNGGIGESPWERNATFPVKIGLVTYNGKMRVTRTPIRRISDLYETTLAWKNETIGPKTSSNQVLSGVQAEAFDLTATFDLNETTAKRVTFQIANKEITYDIEAQMLLGKPLRPDANQRLTLRMLVDWSTLEIFAAGGVFSYSEQFAFTPDDESVAVFTDGGQVKLKSLELHPIKSIW
ncbi:glycoside hydrolase family 32 protein [Rhodopirellula sp. JC740]|uniref:Glycoside hydrolase family 32 protein n=1 Tax=Rhodopirellula halodulae TaxID=2894198 RepID=A0ABS8NNU0_9BACT|nr:glycoside hydrolase family 32 protein [Rhodopirellula sp. JC740]MCC9645259.1 glycoside hydrolase family 32 protein [Rhodopirellula sp. JC740]